MSKAMITRLFAAGCVAFVAGLVVGLAALVVALVNGAISLGGPNVVTVNGDVFGGMLVWLAIAILLAAVGWVAAVASWIGALLNTIQLDDKTWFVALLALGLISFGWVAMVAYVIAGPDSTRRTEAAGGIEAAHVS